MAAVAAEAAATAASPGEGGAGEAEPEMEPIPGSEAGTDPLPVTATEASVPDGETDGQQSAPQADEPPLPPPPPPPGELARSPEAAGPELEAEEKLSVRVAESAAAAPQGGPELPPSPASPPEQPPAPEEREEPPLPQPVAPALVPPAGGDSTVSQLIPGSEVRVTLDHIIEDALVVSFRLGEKLFSGVLMDLSKRYEVQRLPFTAFHSVSCNSTHSDGISPVCNGLLVCFKLVCSPIKTQESFPIWGKKPFKISY
ncbi:PWWP domain-containing protein 2A-like [Hylobates moloch]|uniref:PWWP domain-containing protein 2A-like n=1 Tax=Hylobates moloch TaxID=81572 RepID=UPI00136360A4|nr:PWWP domain-containing protein 2A-like [Hylobates moloch]